MKRFKHSLSNYKLLTTDMGKLVPCNLSEVLPGDTLQQHTSALIRVSPLVAPVMHPVSVRLHHWFVPTRILWNEWEDFITGGPDGTGPAGAYPTITDNFAEGTLPDYLGVPTGVAGTEISALPIRAYNKIFNEFYRDEDLVSEVGEDTTDVQAIAWEKDYFTSARPWPQKGPDITIPLSGGNAPVVPAGDESPIFRDDPETDTTALRTLTSPDLGVSAGASYPDSSTLFWKDPKLEADMSGVTAASINGLREAFALQRYQEARSRYGSRYTEYLRYLGIAPADSRLQRPEYLGGGKQTISFTEVLQTSNDGTNGSVGDLYGHGIAALRSNKYRKFFQEHGFVITLISVRPKTMYADGLFKLWNRRIKEDYWQRELQHIGQQEILNKEVYLAAAAPDDTFGFQDRYAEYRYQPSTIAGEFRSTLNYWHMGRLFSSEPALNQSFTDCVPSKRNYAVQTNDVLWIMASNRIAARRLVAKNAGGHIF